MLNPRGHQSDGVEARKLTDNPYANTMCLGCGNCPDRIFCGGLSVEAHIMSCLDHCCGKPDGCSKVCALNPAQFVSQLREIGGFDLHLTPRVPSRPVLLGEDIVELIYHGSRRNQAVDAGVVALRLADVVDFRKKKSKFPTREALCEAFHLNLKCQIILTGIDHDHKIEPWWTLGSARPAIIQAMVALGITLVTTPNFSLILDHPRTDDLHAMKRISALFAEFHENGMAAALHPNGRTFHDFERWKSFVAERPEIQVLAYEFITGSDRNNRRQFHLNKLAEITQVAGRPLDIIVRGNPQVIPFLRKYFRRVIYIDTTAFMKTQKRRIAERVGNDTLEWMPYETPQNASLDYLLRINFCEQVAYLRATYYDQKPMTAQAA